MSSLTKEDWIFIYRETFKRFYSYEMIENFSPIDLNDNSEPNMDSDGYFIGGDHRNIKKALEIPFNQIPIHINTSQGYEKAVYLLRLKKGE